LELAETLAFTWGMTTTADWIDIAPALSLLGPGVLERPSASMLLLNGVNDTIFPIQDMRLLLQHGRAKAARFFDAGHMGRFDQAIAFTQEWLKSRLTNPAGL
jgi:hypothetical protein